MSDKESVISGLRATDQYLRAFVFPLGDPCIVIREAQEWIEAQPEIVRCRDCIHRGHYDEKLHCVVYPDEKCPALCDDPFYSWRPDDDWFCPNGETME